MKSVPHRNYILLLYPNEDVTHKNALDIITKLYNYAYVIHNQDLDSNGNLKKEHIHILIKFRNARHLNAIAKELGISSNYIRVCDYFNNSLFYLIHYNQPNKHQYTIDEVQGPLKKKLIRLVNDENLDEYDVILDILNFIDNNKSVISISQLNYYCLSKGFWKYYKSSRGLIIPHLEEHNNYIFSLENKGGF